MTTAPDPLDPTAPATTPPPLRAAMVRFATLEPARWESICRALAALGFNAVDVPLVWREHERAAGEYEFTAGRLALGAMLAAVRAAGLRAVVRVGPIVTDDAPGLCLPERVLRDRACQARTRRQNPVLVPDPPRAVPLPSVASAAFRAEATAWVRAAIAALREAERAADGAPVERVILGDGPHASVRDDPYEFDHHPDARGELAAVEPPHDGPHAAALAEVRREAQQAASYRLALLDAAREAGLEPSRCALAVPGAATVSPAAYQLASRYALALPCPPPIAGTLAIWRQVRHAVALTSGRGLHLDVWSGSPPYYPPARGSHTLEAARVALAAGARDFTVRMGCAGDRWVGAVLSERGEPRPHAPQWRALLAWAATLPAGGRELCAELIEPLAAIELARAATAVHPLPLGLLALLGVPPAHLASEGALLSAEGDTLGAHARRLDAAESALITAGLPVRRAPHASARTGRDGDGARGRRDDDDDDDDATGPVLGGGSADGSGDEPSAFAARAAAAFHDLSAAVRVAPAGAALVRAVHDGAHTRVVLASRAAEPATVALHGEGWSDAGGTPVLAGVELALGPGEVLVLSGPPLARGAGHRPARGAQSEPARATRGRRPARTPPSTATRAADATTPRRSGGGAEPSTPSSSSSSSAPTARRRATRKPR